MTNRPTIVTARNAAQRAFADWRTIFAARSGVRSLRWADGGAEKRSADAPARTTAPARAGAPRAGRAGRSSVSSVGGQVTGGTRCSRCGERGGSMPGLPDGDGQRAQRDLAGVDGQDPSLLTLTPKRSMPRGAGPYWGPAP